MTGIIPGENASANEVMNAIGSNFNDTAQMIFNADYLGFDSRLSNNGIPNLKNVLYSTFTSDDVDTQTNVTYDATDDYYFPTDPTTDAQIIIKDEVSTNITNAIPVLGGSFAKTHQDEITNPSFESAITSEWTFSQLVATASGARDNTESEFGSWSYKTTLSGASASGEVIQTGVDLTNATDIGAYTKIFLSGGDTVVTAIYVDNTLIVSRSIVNTSDTVFNWISGEIPISLRTSGKTIRLRSTQTTGAGASTNFDYVDIFSHDETVLKVEVSADGGSNYTEVNNAEIARPTAGTNLWRRYTLEVPTTGDLNIQYNYFSEEAIKHSWY